MLDFKNVETPVFFRASPRPAGGPFSALPDPLAYQTGYRTTMPRLSKSPRTATGTVDVDTQCINRGPSVSLTTTFNHNITFDKPTKLAPCISNPIGLIEWSF